MLQRIQQWLSYLLACTFLVLSTVPAAQAGLFDNADLFGASEGPVDVEEAFTFDYEQGENGALKLVWVVKDGYYLYRDNVELTYSDKIKILSEEHSTAKLKADPLFGDVYVYYSQGVMDYQLSSTTGSTVSDTMTVSYQGCWDGGICYPPVQKTIDLKDIPVVQASVIPTPAATDPAMANADKVIQAVVPQQTLSTTVSEQDQFAQLLSSSSLMLILGAFFVAGLALALTPCVFPMIPILSSIIIGQQQPVSTKRGFFLSLVYVLSVAVTYTVLGIVAGLFGENLQAAFQNAWIIGTFSFIFVLLSLSMFGFYDLQLPNSLQTKLNQMSNSQQGGSIIGVVIMGLLSALIVGPCMAAPLAGALIYIGQTGDPVLGGAALFSLSMGMGVPLLIVGASAGKLLPKAGMWMENVKAGFGVLMLLMAVWMLDRVIADGIAIFLYGMILLVSAVYMKALDTLAEAASKWQRFWKGTAVLLLVYGGSLVIGSLAGSQSLFQPLKGLVAGGGTVAAEAKVEFVKVTDEQTLDQILNTARQNNQPVMLDFYADWCISCIELDNITFVDAGVQQSLKPFISVKIDVTANDADSKALYKRYSVIGPPALIFYDNQGNIQPNMTLIGMVQPDDFIRHVQPLI
ncbi:protein-disulfide reductase DsbD [Aliamphritea hakodatensis]|uniref:protein-disulfide reductase DsbD n=1 Tax=Aliamphritea hakodatensis TaxID=2895352 RepID=UPI0022FD72E0|nr:protein-disulfide reductase DsbD [Aliamphritea hakodatensis]